MENLAPPLEFVLHLRFSLEKGESLKTALKEYVERNQPHCPWVQALNRWMIYKEIGKSTQELILGLRSPHRKAVLEVLEAGFRGEPIYPIICQLEEELIEVSQSELEKFIAVLPFKALIPLLLFQFPAFLLLLLGPLLLNFLSAA